jgi:DNA-binding NtrC family response regulator
MTPLFSDPITNRSAGPSRILIVEDDAVSRKNLCRLLQKDGFEVSGVDGGRQALDRLSSASHDLVVTDLVMAQMDGLKLITEIKSRFPEVEVILITGYASIPTAIEAIKKGAFHYLEKPFRPEEVVHLVRQAVEKKRLRDRVRELEAGICATSSEPVLIHQSRRMAEVEALIKKVAAVECNVLLTGESGTGKELAATMVHFYSKRRDNKLLGINCGGFAEDLLANELFGHEKGAFTGAATARAGLLEAADGGTLFLDEIGEMPQSMQVKLLRAIQKQEVIRVGGNEPIPIDIRIVSATNQDLKQAIQAGLFRQDLYYRLNVVSISIPPLRERKSDIPLLAHFFLNRAVKRSNRKITGFSEEVVHALKKNAFPGNVRELENVVEHAVAMARTDIIQLKDLPPDFSELDAFSFDRPEQAVLPLREMQKKYIQWVLDQTGRNKIKAAELLGIDRSSLWRHLKKNEIDEE